VCTDLQQPYTVPSTAGGDPVNRRGDRLQRAPKPVSCAIYAPFCVQSGDVARRGQGLLHEWLQAQRSPRKQRPHCSRTQTWATTSSSLASFPLQELARIKHNNVQNHQQHCNSNSSNQGLLPQPRISQSPGSLSKTSSCFRMTGSRCSRVLGVRLSRKFFFPPKALAYR